jgi:hypothetical protein
MYGQAPYYAPAYPKPPRERMSPLDIAAGLLLIGAVAVGMIGSFLTAYKIVYVQGGGPDFVVRSTNWFYEAGETGMHQSTRLMMSGFALVAASAVAALAGLLLLIGMGRRAKPVRGLGAVGAGLLLGVCLSNLLSDWDAKRLSDGNDNLKSWSAGPGFWLTLVSLILAAVGLVISVLSLRTPRPAGPSVYGQGYAVLQQPAQYAPQGWAAQPTPQPRPSPPQQQPPQYQAPQPQMTAQHPTGPPPTIPEQLAAAPQAAPLLPQTADPTQTMTVRTLSPTAGPSPTDAVPAQADAIPPAQNLDDSMPTMAVRTQWPESEAGAGLRDQQSRPQTDAVPTDSESPADQQTHVTRIPVEALPSPAEIREQASDS